MKQMFLVALTAVVLATSVLFSSQQPANPPAPEVRIEKEAINPWTSLELNNAPAKFHFAVVTDRTGGHRVKVFEKAVRKLNALQPEFVLSVGDLIEGYTQDPAQVEQEWQEFNGFVQELKMPFFYVPGNHDISNRYMDTEWGKRFGRKYYHFTYKDSLFLILNSEAVPGGDHRRSVLGEEQVAYLRKAITDNANVKWVFAFLHKPLWRYGDADKNGWGALENALMGRRFIAFCGHEHVYKVEQRNGNYYIQLATTGGGSQLRGKAVGEFDQIAWVTVTADGPIVTNLLLDGIVDRDIARDLALDAEMAQAQTQQKAQQEKSRQERKAKETKAKQEKAKTKEAKAEEGKSKETK